MRVRVLLALALLCGCRAPIATGSTPGPLIAIVAGDAASSAAPPSQPPIDRAFAFLEQGDFVSAEPLLRAELAEGAATVPAALALARALCALEEHDEALAAILAGRARASQDHDLRCAHVRILADLDLLTEAEAEWASAVELPDADPSLHVLGATLALEVGDGRRALERLDRVAATAPAAVGAAVEELRTVARAMVRGDAAGAAPRRLFAILRGDRPADERRRAFRTLAASPHHRHAALRTLLAHAGADLLEVGLRGHELDSEDCWLLSGRLDAEDSPRRFRVLHEALVQALGPAVDLAAGAEFEAPERARAARSWSKLCPKRS